MPSLIPPGMRAVSVRVNEVVSVAGFVVPGTRVDVLLTGSPAGTTEPVTATVLENVEVLAAGQQLQRNAEGQPQTVPVITLLTTPEDAQKITMASNDGHIQLTLRNPLDTSEENVQAVRNSALYRGAVPEKPAPEPRPKTRRASLVKPAPATPSVYVIEMIKGDKKEETKF